jgi:hypothetical protein
MRSTIVPPRCRIYRRIFYRDAEAPDGDDEARDAPAVACGRPSARHSPESGVEQNPAADTSNDLIL